MWRFWTTTVAIGLMIWSPAADACSCLGASAAAYYARATHVFVGRALPQASKKKVSPTRLQVLQTLKGKPGAVFVMPQKTREGLGCTRTFRPLEIAVVYVTKGQVGTCDGNYSFEAMQIQTLTELLVAAGASKAPSIGAVTRALDAAVKSYLHKRPSVYVVYPPLAGKKITLGKTVVRFGKSTRKSVITLNGLKLGKLHVISGTYYLEGLQFSVALLENNGKLELLGKRVVER